MHSWPDLKRNTEILYSLLDNTLQEQHKKTVVCLDGLENWKSYYNELKYWNFYSRQERNTRI